MKIDQALHYFRVGHKAERLAHAYVVMCQPRTSGRSFAEQAIAELFCTGKGSAPCGTCDACTRIVSRTLPDVVWVEPQSKSRKISIDQIRQLQQFVFQTSYAGLWKACVISSADRMGDQAANAFLKTLEEPPLKCIFFLLTDSPSALLSTISSRSQRIDISSEDSDLEDKWRVRVKDVLITAGKEDRVPPAFWTGSFTRLLKDMKSEAEEEVHSSGLDDSDETEATKEMIDARVNARYREMRTAVMREVVFWYRDILLLSCDGDQKLVYNKEHLDALRRTAAGLKVSDAISSLKAVEAMGRQMDRSLPDASVVLDGFGNICRR